MLDEMRRMRFVIPPLIFLLVFASAACVSCEEALKFTERMIFGKGQVATNIMATVAVGGILVFAIGYVLSSIAIAPLNLHFIVAHYREWQWNWQTGSITEKVRCVLEKHLGYDNRKEFLGFYVMTAYHHGVLTDGLAGWLARRWAFYTLRINCIAATVLACIVAFAAGYRPKLFGDSPAETLWWFFLLWFFGSMLINTFVCFREMNTMTEFVSMCKNIKKPGVKDDCSSGNAASRQKE